VAASRSFSKINTRKVNLQLVLEIELFMTHTKLRLDVLSVVRKLVKDVVHPLRRDFEKKKFLFLQAAKTTNDHTWVAKILGVQLKGFGNYSHKITFSHFIHILLQVYPS
jgi:hypothetical protein